MTTTEQPAAEYIVTEIAILYEARVFVDLREAAEKVADEHGMSIVELALLLEEHFGVSD